MPAAADIRIELGSTSVADLEEALGQSCTGTAIWSRDGILEHQVSTHEDVQICLRNEPAGERPRTAICLAGTDETLTVATVVPIDRDVDLTDDRYGAVVEEFYGDVLSPAIEPLTAVATLDAGDRNT